jgi:hypothetical protein
MLVVAVVLVDHIRLLAVPVAAQDRVEVELQILAAVAAVVLVMILVTVVLEF